MQLFLTPSNLVVGTLYMVEASRARPIGNKTGPGQLGEGGARSIRADGVSSLPWRALRLHRHAKLASIIKVYAYVQRAEPRRRQVEDAKIANHC